MDPIKLSLDTTYCNTPNIYNQSKDTAYCNISLPQLDYLAKNVSESAFALYMRLYPLCAKTKGILEKPISYLMRMCQWGRRKVINLVNELVKAGCLIRNHRNTYAGRICNQYVLVSPQEVIQRIKDNPRKRGKAVQFSTHSARACTTLIVTRSNDYIINNNRASNDAPVDNVSVASNAEGTLNKNLTEFIATQESITNPNELFTEMLYAIKRRFFAGQGLRHAFNTAKKLVKTGKWSRPYALRKEEPDYKPNHDENLDDPDAPIVFSPEVLSLITPQVQHKEQSMYEIYSRGIMKKPCQRDYMQPGEDFGDALKRLQDAMANGDPNAADQLRQLLRCER